MHVISSGTELEFKAVTALSYVQVLCISIAIAVGILNIFLHGCTIHYISTWNLLVLIQRKVMVI